MAGSCPGFPPPPGGSRPLRSDPQSAGCALLHLSHLLDLAEGNEETAGVTVVPLFEGCPNEKQTNKSGEFRVSFKCTGNKKGDSELRIQHLLIYLPM